MTFSALPSLSPTHSHRVTCVSMPLGSQPALTQFSLPLSLPQHVSTFPVPMLFAVHPQLSLTSLFLQAPTADSHDPRWPHLLAARDIDRARLPVRLHARVRCGPAYESLPPECRCGCPRRQAQRWGDKVETDPTYKPLLQEYRSGCPWGQGHRL